MKSIALDFTNNIVCIMTEGQQGTENKPGLKKESFYKFIPEKYREYNSFTWNFQDNKIAINKEYHSRPGVVYCFSDFIPQLIIPMPGLSKVFNDFIHTLGYEEIDSSSFMDELFREIFLLDDSDENEE